MNLFSELPWRENVVGFVSCAVCFVILLISIAVRASLAGDLAEAKSKYNQKKATNSDARYAVEVLSEELSKYLNFRINGYIGEPKRLDWVENIKRISSELHIPNVQFTLEKTRQAVDAENPHWDPESMMLTTGMHMNFELNHEGDFIEMMDRISEEAKGLLNIEKCEIRRAFEISPSVAYSARLRGKCLLTWYTVSDVISHWGENLE